MSETFRFGNLELPYLLQRPGEHIGERRIEVPIAREWLTHQSKAQVVEVGAVMPYHNVVIHYPVIDPYDPHPTVTHPMDAEAFDFTGRAVLSISTLEHIGTLDYEAKADLFKASRVVRKIVFQASAFLFSIPVGYHPALDAMVSEGCVPLRFMRQTEGNRWEECAPDWNAQYNHPLPYANVVAFISNSFDWAEGASS